MIYYDRRLLDELAALFAPTGPLAWLVQWVRLESLARMDFRREDNERRRGGVQIYFGRTSPLEVLGQARGRIKLTADPEYKAVTPDLFCTHHTEGAAALEPRIREHLEGCRARVTTSFIDGEAVAHNGMMRRYGLGFLAGDPMLAVDSEVVLGFRADARHATGTAHRAAYQADTVAAVHLPASQTQPRKLDAVAILPQGSIGLVEVKDRGGDLVRAAWQAAVHIFNFGRLMEQQEYDLTAVVNGMVDQKVALGLLPPDSLRAASQPALVPVVAAPEDNPDWKQRWMAKLGPILAATSYLFGLRLWRLSATGEILEEQRP